MPAISEQEYRQLKKQVDEAKSEADRAQGNLDQLMGRLKKEFGCASIKEAKQKLQELDEESNAAEKAFTKAVNAYQEKWQDGSRD